MEKRGKRQAASIFGGMGFYIALLVCVVAAGVVGYVALSREETAPQDGQDQTVTVDQTDPGDETPVYQQKEEDAPARPVSGQKPVTIPAVPSDLETDTPAQSTGQLQEPVSEVVSIPQTPAAQPQAPVAAPKTESRAVSAPLSGETVAVFSLDQLTYDATLGDWRTHDGVDIQAAAGTEVTATAAGTVKAVTDDGRMGPTVVIDHGDGYVTTYASLQMDPPVLAGDHVEAGAVIGTVGNTSLTEAALGAHLHFSVSKDGQAVDPSEYLG